MSQTQQNVDKLGGPLHRLHGLGLNAGPYYYYYYYYYIYTHTNSRARVCMNV